MSDIREKIVLQVKHVFWEKEEYGIIKLLLSNELSLINGQLLQPIVDKLKNTGPV